MIINGVELQDLDVADADVLEMYENAMSSFYEKMQGISKDDKKGSQLIREECHAIFEVFNEIFGEGTDRKVFGDKTNLMVCIDALQQLKSTVEKTDRNNAQKIASLYDPALNRQQRREINKGKKNKKPYYNKPKLVK